MYAEDNQNECREVHVEKRFTKADDLGQVCEYLIHLMSSATSLDLDSEGSQTLKKRLLEEIETFFRTLTVEDDG